METTPESTTDAGTEPAATDGSAVDVPATGERAATGLAEDAANIGRGLLMGGADIIPGVSGGTVALIVGVYERLVTAISRFDLRLVGHVRDRDWRAAARHVDLRFLVTLGLGIVLGIGGLATLMEYLLEHQQQPTYAAFFGLILASSVIVAGHVERWSPAAIGLIVGGAVFAFWLVGLLPAVPPAGYPYVFLCGAVGICAMILPGISGAFILLILGKYKDITGLIKGAVHREITVEGLITIAVFGAGCVIGLLLFSKLLKWLLARHASPTMAILCGFMIGSLRKIWPFKEGEATDEAKLDLRPNAWPKEFGADEWTCIGLAIVAFVAVVALHRLGGAARPSHAEPPEPRG